MERTQTVAAYTALIRRHFPEIEPRTARAITSGWDSFVLEINDELIFRFPRRQDVEERIQQEMRLLPVLEKHLTTPIPHFAYIGRGDEEYSYTFVGYRKIDGTPLDAENITARQLARLAPAVAAFLSELHSFPLEQAPQAGFPQQTAQQWQQTWRREYQERYSDLQRRIFPRLDERLRSRTRELWEGFLDAQDSFSFRPTLVHRDLGCEHIFCDPARGTLTGVIDWGDASIGDPAIDFVGLQWGHGRTFVEQVAAHYRGEVDSAFWKRMDFYLAYGPYAELLYGAYEGDETFIARGMAGLRGLFGA